MLATLASATTITAAAIAGLSAAAMAVGADVDPVGLICLAAVTLLLAAVAALVVAWLRNTAAVTTLAVFGAYGNPYLQLPAWTGLALLAAMAVLGGLAAAAIAHCSPKVAT